jgi:hypothetical protein
MRTGSGQGNQSTGMGGGGIGLEAKKEGDSVELMPLEWFNAAMI